jgi:hypothetical protein
MHIDDPGRSEKSLHDHPRTPGSADLTNQRGGRATWLTPQYFEGSGGLRGRHYGKKAALVGQMERIETEDFAGAPYIFTDRYRRLGDGEA